MTLDDALRAGSVLSWSLCLASIVPAMLRLARGCGRHEDPIWAVVFLLAINRLTFLFRISVEFSHVSAMILALTMAGFASWYQRHDT